MCWVSFGRVHSHVCDATHHCRSVCGHTTTLHTTRSISPTVFVRHKNPCGVCNLKAPVSAFHLVSVESQLCNMSAAAAWKCPQYQGIASLSAHLWVERCNRKMHWKNPWIQCLHTALTDSMLQIDSDCLSTPLVLIASIGSTSSSGESVVHNDRS